MAQLKQPFFVQDFVRIAAPHPIPQQEIAHRIATCHHQYGADLNRIQDLIKRLIPNQISRRGSTLPDFHNLDWTELTLEKKIELSSPAVEEATHKILSSSPATNSIFHVTCTSYTAPSPIQTWIARNKLKGTTATHLYHMGCYASIPAIRLATQSSHRTQIIHTEMCSLHLSPWEHGLENLVIESLFADGFIGYAVSPTKGATPALEILGLREEILPDTETHMAWRATDRSFKMALSREVPHLISKTVPSFVSQLIQDVEPSIDLSKAYFAIHPGGPKIIDEIQAGLKLSEEQITHSRKVLYENGNMSSATLPYIWEEIVKEPEIRPGAHIVSLAFGPGLTFCGAIFRKAA